MSAPRPFTARVFIGVSVDGFIARPDGDLDWLNERGEAAGRDLGYQAFIDGVDTVVMGRATYEKMLTFGPDAWSYDGKHVAVLSTRLPADADPRVTVYRSMDDLVAGLTWRGAKSVYADGGQVVRAFLRAGLVDDLTITTVPVLIGRGLPLFGDLDADVPLTLRSVEDMGAGVVQAVYAVDR
ncbi:dihydrofolate reductase family protein [Actinomadura kijaniata]|uniref:dihydrofolate reductase family protein n=1 Tax=Actinomadura kijaniata TaxID=46161 RepID=UPI00082BF981|nr:dihydrofolate reductase family protein [Actinomadura kijaniata]